MVFGEGHQSTKRGDEWENKSRPQGKEHEFWHAEGMLIRNFTKIKGKHALLKGAGNDYQEDSSTSAPFGGVRGLKA